MTPRIEKTVFISYRRTNLSWALNVYQDLTYHGYDVFFDYQSINAGDFDTVILDNIKARAHFIVILTPSALDRCKEPDDWLRREIETAIVENRNIVPLMIEGFDFGSPLVIRSLTGKLRELSNKNGLPIYSAYFLEGMEKLRIRYLNIALADVPLKPLSTRVQEVTNTQKAAATIAVPVDEEQLNAQEWFEKGYLFQKANNYEEAIRCYDKSTQLDSNLDTPYNNLGFLYSSMKRYTEAEAAYRKAIEVDPQYATAYHNLGKLLKKFSRFEEADALCRIAAELDPSFTFSIHDKGEIPDMNYHYYREEEVVKAVWE